MIRNRKKKLYKYKIGGELCIKLLNYKKMLEVLFSGKN